jgi:hypothetical protein
VADTVERACGAFAHRLGLVDQVRGRSVLPQQPVQVVQRLGMIVSTVPTQHQLHRHGGDQAPVELQQRVAAKSHRPRTGRSPHRVNDLEPAVEHQRVGRSRTGLDAFKEIRKLLLSLGHALQGPVLRLSESGTRRTVEPTYAFLLRRCQRQ